MTASTLQTDQEVYSLSAGGSTGDGRTYPMLVAPHYSCGVAASNVISGPYVQDYGQFGATSSATPAVAGAAGIFKHWYLANHGPSSANQTGRMMSNMLNFADGVCFGGWGAGRRTRVDPPQAGWGLGNFRMRLYESSHMASPWRRQTSSFALDDGGCETILIGGPSDDVPATVERLRITIWWLEVNTGPSQGSDKMKLTALLFGGTPYDVIAAATNGRESMIRFQYDCRDPYFGRPPTGKVHLVLLPSQVPAETRFYGRSYRTVYVSWFWESGPDSSLVNCTPPPPCDRGFAVQRRFVDIATSERERLVQLVADRVEQRAAQFSNVRRGPDWPSIGPNEPWR